MSQKKYSKKHLRHHKKKSPWAMIVMAIGGLLLIFGVAYAFNRPSQPKAAIEVFGSPGMKVDKDQVDLGDIKLGRTVQVSFQLTNVGDQTLRFTQAPYVEVVEGC